MEKKTGRLLSLILAAVLSLSLAACGNESKEEDTADKSSTAASADKEEKTDDEKPVGDTKEKDEEPSEAEDEEPSKAEDKPAAEAKPIADIISETAAPEIKSATLKEVGKLENADAENYDVFLYKSISDDEIQCLDYKGEPLMEGKVDYVEKLGDTGLYVYYTVPEGDIDYCGIMDAEGNVILSTDEKVGTFDAIDDRFVKAYLPEAVTTSKDDAIYYSTSRQFSIDVGDDDVMYSGTVKLYDLQEKKFLENTAQKFDPNYKIGDDIISYYDEDYNSIAVTTDDKLIDLGDMTVVGDLLTEYTGDTTNVYDKDMNLLFTTPYTLSEITNTTDFYSAYDSESGMRGIIHKSGTVIAEPKYNTISYLSDGMFTFNGEDLDKTGMLYVDGTEVVPAEYKYINETGVPGFYNACKQDGKYDIIDSEGNKVVSDMEYSYSVGGYVKDGDDYTFLVTSTKDMSLKIDCSSTYLGDNLLYDFSNKVIYDLVTGEKVMEGFDTATQAYGFIYIVNGDDTTIYKAETEAE